MTRRLLPYLAATVLVGQALLHQGCSGGNEPSTPVTRTGGATGVTGSTGGYTGSPTGTSSGGAAGTGTVAGTGGTVVSAAGTGGSAAATPYSPLCSVVPVTAAGAAPTKGGVCVAADSQLCYKTCGPLSVGFKSEICTAGTYTEMSGCSFPPGDYSCFKIPAAIDASCPATAPQASQPCTVAKCVLCNVNGSYLDSSGAAKEGYCVCPEPGAGGTSKWSCASTTAWPCPSGQGC